MLGKNIKNKNMEQYLVTIKTPVIRTRCCVCEDCPYINNFFCNRYDDRLTKKWLKYLGKLNVTFENPYKDCIRLHYGGLIYEVY